MTPKQFEEYVCELFIRKGYKSETTPFCSDYGVDVFAVKGKEKIAIQAKMYGGTSRKINRQMVMELEGAKKYFDCTKAVIATDGLLLDDAKQVADKLQIEVLYLSKIVLPAKSTKKNAIVTFEKIWDLHIIPLKGKKLMRSNGEFNEIVKVDWSGIERITSTGKKGKIKIEIFKYAVDKLLSDGRISRDEINQNYVGRASSGVILILSQVPFFKHCVNPSGLAYTE
jgi:restriction system protein